jgi:hypothetical protein
MYDLILHRLLYFLSCYNYVFVRPIIIATLNKKWVTIYNLNDNLYGMYVCTENWTYIIM